MDLLAMDRALAAYAPLGGEADRSRLEFFAGLYRLQDGWSARLAAHSGYEAPAADELEAWYWAHEPAFAHLPVAIDAPLFAQTLADVASYLSDNAGLDDAVAAGLKALDWEAFTSQVDLSVAGCDPAAFIETCLSNVSSLGIAADVPATLFGMTLSCALRAWLQRPAEAVMAAAPRNRENHDCPLDCPVCGTPPAASFVGESAGTDGKGRMQYCAACGAKWPYERIRCGVCGDFNQRHLHYFNLEGDNAHRIQSCDSCGQYQRVVFQEDIPGPLCMEVEDVVMAKLDRVALDPRFRKEAAN